MVKGEVADRRDIFPTMLVQQRHRELREGRVRDHTPEHTTGKFWGSMDCLKYYFRRGSEVFL